MNSPDLLNINQSEIPNYGSLTPDSFKFGMNAPTFNAGFRMFNSGMQAYNALQSMRLAREQFDFTKNHTQKNLSNQVTTYNTQLGDRARVRGVMEGQSQQQVSDYINRNRLTA